MDEKLLRERGDALDRLGLEWELFAIDQDSLSLEVRQREVDAMKSSRNQGIALRVREEGRIGFSFATDLTDSSFERMLEQARASAKAFEPNEFARFSDESAAPPDLPLVDPAPRRSTEEAIESARQIEAAALSTDERVKRIRKASYAESNGWEWLLNSHGLFRCAQSTFFSASVLAIAEADGESESGGEFQFGRTWGELDYDWVGREAARRAVGGLGGRPIPTGVRPIVFENRVVASLLGIMSPSFVGESVQRNRSLLAGKMGQAIMSPLINLYDDGLDVRGAAAFPFDGEGTPQQQTPLVIDGELKNFLYDLESGARDNRGSTGNANRSGFRAPPGPSTTNLRLDPGSGTMEELCSEIGSGFLVTDLLGLHTANPISGEFSLGASGFEIVNGEIGGPVRGVALADNVLGLFRKATRIGSDFRYFGSIGAASMAVPDVSVSGG